MIPTIRMIGSRFSSTETQRLSDFFSYSTLLTAPSVWSVIFSP